MAGLGAPFPGTFLPLGALPDAVGETPHHAAAAVLIELGLVFLVLAVLGRVAARIGIPSVPLYLVAGLLNLGGS